MCVTRPQWVKTNYTTERGLLFPLAKIKYHENSDPVYTIHAYTLTRWVSELGRKSLLQIVACSPFGAKPLPEPVYRYCLLNLWEQIPVQLESYIITFIQESAFENVDSKWRPCRLGLNVLSHYTYLFPVTYHTSLLSNKDINHRWLSAVDILLSVNPQMHMTALISFYLWIMRWINKKDIFLKFIVEL